MITLKSSHGLAKFDYESGELIQDQLNNSFGVKPKKLDLNEYEKRVALLEDNCEYHILDWSYWLTDGTYIQAAETIGPLVIQRLEYVYYKNPTLDSRGNNEEEILKVFRLTDFESVEAKAFKAGWDHSIQIIKDQISEVFNTL